MDAWFTDVYSLLTIWCGVLSISITVFALSNHQTRKRVEELRHRYNEVRKYAGSLYQTLVKNNIYPELPPAEFYDE